MMTGTCRLEPLSVEEKKTMREKKVRPELLEAPTGDRPEETRTKFQKAGISDKYKHWVGGRSRWAKKKRKTTE